MSRSYKTESIVLKKRNLLNKNSLITLFSQKYGKINVIAYGIKKITSRRLPYIETANLINIYLFKKNSFFYLKEVQLVSLFSQIKKSSYKLNYLYFIFFTLDRLLPENQQEDSVYLLFKKFLFELSKNKSFDNKRLTFYFKRILYELGYLGKEKSLDELISLTEETIGEKLPLFII